MLVRFTVSNFRSMRYEQEISMVAMDEHPDLATQPIPGSSHEILPVAGIFGPNASGKSNFIRAFQFFSEAVRESHQRWIPDAPIHRVPYFFRSECFEEPSTFTAEFVANGQRYQYYLACDNERFITETLYAYGSESRRRRMIFDRQNTTEIEYGPTFKGARRAIEEALRPNSTLISAAATFQNATLRPVYDWFGCLRVAMDDNFSGRLGHTIHMFQEHDRQKVLDLLKFADFDITDIVVERKKGGKEQLESQLFDETETLTAAESVHAGNIKEFDVKLVHESGSFPLPLWIESNGTRTWLSIIGPVLGALRYGWVFVIDEIDARLHTVLVSRLIKLFQDPDTNPHGAQLIFNTHDTNLLGPSLSTRLHRDQIWFTERSTPDGTRLWPLTEYRVRDGVDNIERSYLRGRYGAVPEVDDFGLSHLHGEDEERGGESRSSDPEAGVKAG